MAEERISRTEHRDERDLARQLEASVLRKAEKLARRYSLVIEPQSELGYVGRTIEMPMVMCDGKTVEACVRSVLEATIATIATMLEAGETLPVPIGERIRDQQLNIRISAHERERLEALARAGGYDHVSDYVRSAALRSAR